MDPGTLLALGAALFFGGKKKAADKIEYFPLNLEIIKGKLVYSMDILNPTKNKLKIDSFFGGVFVDDNKIGSIERGKPFEINPNGRTKVKFPVEVSPVELAKLLLAIAKGNFKKQFKIAGIARAYGLDNEVSKEISLAK